MIPKDSITSLKLLIKEEEKNNALINITKE